MSVEEDTELRDLVTQTLEANGCLSKIKVSTPYPTQLAVFRSINYVTGTTAGQYIPSFR